MRGPRDIWIDNDIRLLRSGTARLQQMPDDLIEFIDDQKAPLLDTIINLMDEITELRKRVAKLESQRLQTKLRSNNGGSTHAQ